MDGRFDVTLREAGTLHMLKASQGVPSVDPPACHQLSHML